MTDSDPAQAHTLAHKLAQLEASEQRAREAEAALRAAEAQMRFVADHAPVAIAHCDSEPRYKFVNQQYAAIFGLKPADIIGKHPRDILPASTYTHARPYIAAALAGQSVGYDIELPDSAIGPCTLQVSYVPERDAAGRVVGFLGAVLDITARKTVEERLRRTTEMADIAVWEYDFFAGHMNRSANHDTLYGLGWQARWDVDTFLQATHPDDRDHCAALIEQAVAPGGPDNYAFDFRVIWPDSSIHWLWVRGQVTRRDPDGHGLIVRGVLLDITARKQAEAKLRESEQRYRSLFANMAAGFVLFEVIEDGAGRPVDLMVLAANKGFDAATGLDSASLIGKRLTDVLPGIENDAADWIGTYGRIAQHGPSRQFENYSELLGYHYAVAAYQAAPGQCAVTFTDITERKQAEIALAEERGLLKALIQTLPDLVWLKDPAGGYLACNPRFEDFVGEREADILGKTDYALFDQELADFFRRQDQTAVDAGRPVTNEETVTFADGHQELLQTIKTPMIGADGKLHGVLGTGRDITALREDQAWLRKLSLAVEQSPGSIVITNVDAEIEYVNEAFVRISGYAREEVLGRNARFLRSGKTPADTYANLWATLGEGRSWKGEFINQRKDGSEFTEFAIISPIRQPDGHISHYVAVKEDVTEKKRAGEELDRYRKHLEDMVAQRTADLEHARAAAEAANLAKSTFLANMSHEIRTPMNAIVGLTHLLRRENATPQQTERLAKIDSAAQHLLSIISDILDLSKIEAAKLQLEHRDFALGAVLDHTRSMISDAAQAKGLAVIVDCDAVPVWLCGDSTRLRQALLNYASNAVKFTTQGSITLRATLLASVGPRLQVRFEVEDTGIGIDATTRAQLFQAFEQADASTTRKFGGTGLGLVITRRLAELMGGEAGVDSEPGRGSRFWFSAWLERGHGVMVPAAPPDEDAESALRQQHFGARILLVEDNPINREVAFELLHAVGLAVDTAENGQAAVDMAGHNDYDLILMDVQMPVMDGLAATRAIRKLPRWSDRPVLAMSANVFTDDRSACLAAGMDDFVAKPVDPPTFYTTLLKWLPARTGQATPGATPAPEPATATSALDKLHNQPGIDVARGLALLRGNQDTYLKLLHLFVREHQDDMSRLAQCMANDDRATACAIAHTLKGVAGNVGATAIATAATELNTL
ncbi:MAG: PAS domain S-box protein, partial [Proteobacteria bacterium]